MNPAAQNPLPMPAIAIIGIGCIFPKSPNLKAFWQLLLQGKDAITDVPETHWSPKDYFSEDPKKPDHVYCKRGGFLSAVSFDPSRFGIPPAILEATDTSQLLALAVAQAALEDAGYGESVNFDRDRTAVILGVTGTQELVIPLGARLGHPIWRKALKNAGVSGDDAERIIAEIAAGYVSWKESSFPGLLGNVVAGRITNRLNLGGTNCVVDAACASSMSAVNHAILELETGRADMAITGGVDTLNDIFMHMCFSRSQILSPTGDVRPFSKDADGTLLGEGVGLLVMKRLQDAEMAGDRIYAVIKGLGSSSDGRSQSIYAPNPEGQAKALERAYARAGIDPATVGMVEAHGTGTRVGDEVEFRALTQVFGAARQGQRLDKCAVGSVKSMIGHTKAAAGTAGLIKTALALYHKSLPPTLKASEPDPKLQVDESPFYIASRIRPWFSDTDTPRRCGVSAFGFGGSNYHAVLEEYQPMKKETAWDGSVEIIALSGSDIQTLETTLSDWIRRFEEKTPWETIAVEAGKSRAAFQTSAAFRLLVALDLSAQDSETAAKTLRETAENLAAQSNEPFWKTGAAVFGTHVPPGKLAFVFPGQGSQYVEMGKDLMLVFPEAFAAMERMNAAFDGDTRLSDFIHPLPSTDTQNKKRQEEALRSTDRAQPAIGAVSVAMMRVLERFGIRPDATGGHSYGELPALLAAGRIDDDSLCRLSVARGRLMAEAGKSGAGDPGTMLAVKAPLAALKELVGTLSTEDVVLANLNSPDQGVLSGSTAGIDAAEKACKAKKMKAVRLPVAAAFHSRLVASAKSPFEAVLERETFRKGRIPVMSNTTGNPYPDDPGAAKAILGSQIVHSVDFVANVENLYDMGVRTFLEVGPKTVLSGLVKAILGDRPFHTLAVDASGGKKFGLLDLAMSLCHVAALGYPVNLTAWEPPKNGNDPEKPKMAIPISGANYRSPGSSVIAKAPEAPQKLSPPLEVQIKHPPAPEIPLAIPPVPPPVPSQPSTGIPAPDVLRVVEEGLKSIQQIQAHTADAHKKFLDTQTEASRALQAMMESTRRMAEAFCGIAPSESLSQVAFQPAPVTPPQAASPEWQAPKKRSSNPVHVPEPISAPISAWLPEESTAPAMVKPDPPAPSPQAQTTDLSRILLEVVSQLTGYPETMLELTMDLEADLGIDSIKRVEILSTLEERMPLLPQIPPEKLGTLKTLEQIVAALGDTGTEIPGPAPAAPVATVGSETGGEVASTLLEVVSQLTGYPTAMLDLAMDLEADLGIDSIKRVEILSTLEERMPHLPQVTPENMASLKTLGQIVTFLCGEVSQNIEAGAHTLPDSIPSAKEETNPFAPAPPSSPPAIPAPLRVVRVIQRELDLSEARKKTRGIQGTVLITEDAAGMSMALKDAFTQQGIDARILKKSDFPTVGSLSGIGGAVLLSPMTPEAAFSLVKSLEPALARPDGSSLAKCLVCVTRMDGGFGFSGGPISDPMDGALCGLVKTAAQEWNGVFCRAVDLAPEGIDPKSAAGRVLDEILFGDPEGPVEVGFSIAGRQILDLFPTDYEAPQTPLKPTGAWVVTGGAKGVTAACIKALAPVSDVVFVLIGRSPAPTAEPPWLAGITDPGAMKAAILANAFNGRNPTPSELESVYGNYSAAREIANTLETLNRTGRGAAYLQTDVLDPDAVSKAMKTVRERYGAITGLVHGAGVLRDRWIKEKSMNQFHQVFDTKVMGLMHLLAATRTDLLDHVILFSSVAARSGNPGQADYAMANEVLNKTAWLLKKERTGLRVLSINWGPWDGGMVSPALKKMFIARGVPPISMAAGAESFARLIAGLSPSTPAEVFIGQGLDAPTGQPLADPALSLSFRHELNTEQFPILSSHAPSGVPSVPLSLMAEWFGLGAIHANPGLYLHGIDDLRLFEELPVTREGKTIRLMSGKARKIKKGRFEVDVELRNGMRSGVEFVHSKARAVLGDRPATPPDLTEAPIFDARPDSLLGAEAVYNSPPLSGVGLKGIRRVTAMDPSGAAAEIDTAPPPEKWMAAPLRNHWIADPLAIEAAFQLICLWAFEYKGGGHGIHRAESYRQYCRQYPREGVSALLKIRAATDKEIVGDVTFLGPERTIVAQIKGCVATALD